jgi:coenzyme F420-0:L-glutamate ligase/coenzyme F420-1:gamma-L-glutamate ligase
MLKVIPLQGFPIVKKGDSIGQLIIETAKKGKLQIENGDILIIAQSIVSRVEGRVVNLKDIEPSKLAEEIAKNSNKDPRHVEVILQEAKNICMNRNGVLVTETKHGFVCANSGVDKSNVPGNDNVTLLPVNPDESAKKIRKTIEKESGKEVAVIISDTHNRPFRLGAINIAIGCSGINPIKNYLGEKDLFEYELKSTSISVADQLCSAAGLVMGEGNEGLPVIVIKGYDFISKEIPAIKLIRPEERDYFR